MQATPDTGARISPLLALLALLAGCAGGPSRPETRPETRPASRPRSADLTEVTTTVALPPDRPAALARTDTLNQEPLTASTDGPWRIRRGPARSPREDATKDRALATMASPAPGVPPTALAYEEAPPADAPRTPPAEPRVPPADAGSLRAGSTDDNENFGDFLEYLRGWDERQDLAERSFVPLDVMDRRFIEVTDLAGAPVPAARVRLIDEAGDRIVWSGTTYGDGRAPYYPGLAGVAAKHPPLLLEVRAGEARALKRWSGEGEHLVVALDVDRGKPGPLALDVLFLIDTTGSMADEIARIKATLLEVTARLRALERELELRYAAVLYRDLGDAYVTKHHPFTTDIAGFDAALQAIAADGGGDTPESLNQGLAEAVGATDWRPGAARVLFLIADAPPHLDYPDDVLYPASLRAALDRGIRIHTVAASGLDEQGTLVFRQIAQLGRGKFLFIEYGSAAATAARHGVQGPVESNNLDAILFRELAAELAAWGRRPHLTRQEETR